MQAGTPRKGRHKAFLPNKAAEGERGVCPRKEKLTQKGAPEPPGGTLFLLEKDVTVATCRSCRYICREQPAPGTALRTCFPCDVLSGFPVWPT